MRIGAGALLTERRALANAETMLLVDDREAEPLERDVLLDERVRADRDVDRTIGEPREYFAPPVAGDARRKERMRRPAVREERRERPGMLLGEQLGRCHERGLRARAGSDTRRKGGDDRLSRADVALEQPRHGHALAEIRADLLERSLLRARERERQLRDPARQLGVRDGERERRRLSGPTRASLRQSELEHEELVEREPASGREQALDVVGKVHLPQGRCDVGKPMALANGRRERLGHFGHDARSSRSTLDRGVQPAAHLARLDAFRERIDRHEASGMHGLGVGALERRLAELKCASEESDLS